MTNRIEHGGEPLRAELRYRVDHLGLTVPDLDEAVGFFTAHLDAEVVFRLGRFIDESGEAPARLGADPSASFALAMLRVGDAEIELLQWWPALESADDGTNAPNRVGAAHLALSVADVAETYERLCAVPGVRRLGSPVTFSGDPTDGLTNAFVATPWGLLIELMGWPRG